MTWDAFQNVIAKLLSYSSGLSFEFKESQINYTIDGKTFTYTRQEFEEIDSSLTLYTQKPTCIFNQNEIEMLIDPLEPRMSLRYQDEALDIVDDVISYRISAPSLEMILAFISSIPESEIRSFRRPIPGRLFSQRYNGSEVDDIKLFDLILRVTRMSMSLKISSPVNPMPVERFQRHANSFLFNYSYNTGAVFKPISDIADLSFDRRDITPRRRLRAREMETPKLFYNSELTEQYNLALSSSDPFIEFIAYYHIMEHFFDDVYSGALISSVKEILLHPGFSAKKPKDISKIINVVQQKTKIAKEGFQGSELEALELTIKAFISTEELLANLCEYDPALIGYYKTHEVSFSNGDTVNFEDVLNEKLPKKIAARIYKTRNSLVHSKSNNTRVKDRGIYHPFSDEKELAKEIPLMKLIAEAIIIKSAEEI